MPPTPSDRASSPPLVTVVTPTYRRTETLLRAARSVAAQDHPAVEHLVVGDRCDLLPDLAPRLREISPGIRILYAPDWSHPAAAYLPARIARARNLGVVAASGEYVCQIDSDNVIEPDHVSSHVELLERERGLVGASAWRRLLWDDGSPYLEPYHPWDEDEEVAASHHRRLVELGVYETGSPVMKDRLIVRGQPLGIDANQFFFRREAHLEYLFPTRFLVDGGAALGEDDALSLRLLADGVGWGYTGRATIHFYLGGRFTLPAVRRRG